MLQVALLCLLVGQVPPPPIPHPPESYSQSSSSDQSPADPQSQREWLLSHLVADLQAQGRLDAQKYRDVERMVHNVSDSEVRQLVQYYRDLSKQAEARQLAEAQANLRRLEAYRDRLKVEVERRKQIYEQEQAMAAYSSALAAQQAQWAMGNFYAGPYYAARPYYYLPHHHRHHW